MIGVNGAFAIRMGEDLYYVCNLLHQGFNVSPATTRGTELIPSKGKIRVLGKFPELAQFIDGRVAGIGNVDGRKEQTRSDAE